MTQSKLHPPWPWFLLTALLGLVPVLNNMHPALFFPALPSWGVEVASVFAGIYCAMMGFLRGWGLLQQRAQARALVKAAIESRHPSDLDPNEVSNAGRFISRMVRHCEQDLREIRPDFTPDSLKRLQAYLPELLLEIGNEENALILVGVVGTYLGETLCRNSKWKWFFQADPAMNQFSYLSSVLRNPQEARLDPYAWAADLLTGRRKMHQLLKEA